MLKKKGDVKQYQKDKYNLDQKGVKKLRAQVHIIILL